LGIRRLCSSCASSEYPHRDVAELAVKVVGALDLAVNVVESWLEKVPIEEKDEEDEDSYYREQTAWDYHNEALGVVDELVGRVRVVED
jgi:hypothetical protein